MGTITDMEARDSADIDAANGSPIRSDDSGRDREISILSLEYTVLKTEIIGRMSGRFQFLGFTTASAALLGSVIGRSPSSITSWILAGLAVGVLLFGVYCFMALGRLMTKASAHVASIEKRINALASDQAGSAPLLTWESIHQERNPLETITLGSFPRRAKN